jgi:hypothetical protein
MSCLKMADNAACFLASILALNPPCAFTPVSVSPPQIPALIARMEARYALVDHYQTETTVRLYRDGQLTKTQRFLYTFRKPNHVRAELRSPHPGTVLVYPDAMGKVLVKPGGWLGFLKLHIAVDSAALRSRSGQRIDQTDMGLLIQNIAHSLTDRRHGDVTITHNDDAVVVEVLADDHFLPDALTLYRFTIDDASGLPIAIEELTPDGVPKRDLTFQALTTWPSLPVDAPSVMGGRVDDARAER